MEITSKPLFLTEELGERIDAAVGTPCYVYSETIIEEQVKKITSMIPPHVETTVRFAMKACPNGFILKYFLSRGLSFDASSGFEVRRAAMVGIPFDKISLSSQELPTNFDELIQKGVTFNACSLHQLNEYGKRFPHSRVGVRFNPGVGSGGSTKTNVGGVSSSFGVWYRDVDKVKDIATKYGLTIERIHTHIGSGTDPTVWMGASLLSLKLVDQFESVTTLNLGGGFKVARMKHEKSVSTADVGREIAKCIEEYRSTTGRELRLEIEPGTFLVCNGGSLLCKVGDIVSTSSEGSDDRSKNPEGYTFIKLNTGMNDIMRQTLYGAEHPIVPLKSFDEDEKLEDVVVVGHCCESGDLLSVAAGEPQTIKPSRLPSLKIGDLVAVEGAGVYCASMSAKNYNSFPESPEVFITGGGKIIVIRKRQSLEQLVANEVSEEI